MKLKVRKVWKLVPTFVEVTGENLLGGSLPPFPHPNLNRVKVKKGFYLYLLTPETIKLLESTKSKIRKDKNGENVPYLEITEVV